MLHLCVKDFYSVIVGELFVAISPDCANIHVLQETKSAGVTRNLIGVTNRYRWVCNQPADEAKHPNTAVYTQALS